MPDQELLKQIVSLTTTLAPHSSPTSQTNNVLISFGPPCISSHLQQVSCVKLALNFLVAVVNSLNTKAHSSEEMAEFCFENADIRSICYCKQRMKSTLSLSSECVEIELCKPCTSFTSHPYSLCGMMWYRTLRVKVPWSKTWVQTPFPLKLFRMRV